MRGSYRKSTGKLHSLPVHFARETPLWADPALVGAGALAELGPAAASMLRGGNYRHAEESAAAMVPVPDLSGSISTTKGSQLDRR
jgi:hypothetical protein